MFDIGEHGGEKFLTMELVELFAKFRNQREFEEVHREVSARAQRVLAAFSATQT